MVETDNTSSGILKQPMRHTITTDVSTIRENSNLSRATPHLNIVSPHSRTSDCSSKQSKPSWSNDSIGVVPSATCFHRICETWIIHHVEFTANNRRSGAWRFNDLLLGKSSGLYETLEIPGWLFRNLMWSPTIVPKCEYFVCSVAFNTS